jgi:hypothetical protein
VATAFINDPEHWKQRAEEARALADQLNDEASKQAMLRIAADYDRLAERAAYAHRAHRHNAQRACRRRAEFDPVAQLILKRAPPAGAGLDLAPRSTRLASRCACSLLASARCSRHGSLRR